MKSPFSEASDSVEGAPPEEREQKVANPLGRPFGRGPKARSLGDLQTMAINS